MKNNPLITFNTKTKFLRVLFFVVSTLHFCSNIALAQTIPKPEPKPNIVFILADDLGWNGLSSYGNQFLTTPNIDRLANEGMKFTHAYVAPECTPSRAEFLSGQYGARTGITEVRSRQIFPNAPLTTPESNSKLPEHNYTIANMLRDAGYTTMISGKWHVGDNYRVANLKERYSSEYFQPYGFDYIGDAKENGWGKVDKDKGAMDIVNDFFRFLQTKPEHPFFAYLPFFSPHTPIDAPDSLVNKFLSRGFPKSTDRFGDATQKPTADYLAMIKYLDDCIGVLLDRLDQTGLSKNTIVVFTSDNGALARAWDNCPLRGAKGVLYEGGVRVPLLARWPGKIPAGNQTDSQVDIVDMFATFKDIAGGTIPQRKVLDGVSLLPLLMQQGDHKSETLYWHHPQYIHDYGQTPSSSIRRGNYKLIHYYGDYLNTKGLLPMRKKAYGKLEVGEKIELYDIKADPSEQNDLSERFPKKTEELLRSLKEWLNEVNASKPHKNPDMEVSSWAEPSSIHK